MADRLGQQLGNHRLVRLLGRGGFAEVYLGEHVRLNTLAAVKVLYTRLANPGDVEHFEQEARTIAHLNHPHIVRVFDFDVQDDTPFLIMDYAPGGTLRQRHAKGTILPLATIVSYVGQIADALQYAHDQRLIHRDIKPENMLIGPRHEVLLSDFGIATVAQSSRYQSTQDMAGTIAYMAPEQIQAHPRPASDQYSLGIVVYEWLCGERPFHGLFTEIAVKHSTVPPPPLREKLPTISPLVEQVVMTALAKNPKERFSSVQAFAHALEEAGRSGQAHEAPLPRSLPPTPAPHAIPPSTVTPPQMPTVTPQAGPAPLHPIMTDTTLEPSGPKISAPEHTPAPVFPTSRTTPPPSPHPTPPIAPPTFADSTSTSPLTPARSNLSRRSITVGLATLAVVGTASGGFIWLARQQTSAQKPAPAHTSTPPPHTTTLYTYRGHSSTVNAVAWSPDGSRIASGGFDHTVQVWDALTGNNVLTYRGHSRGVHGVAWSPDGSRIASGSEDQTVQVWDATTGRTIFTYRGHYDFVNAVAWSPDGSRIASASGDPPGNTNDNTVQICDATNGQRWLTYWGHAVDVHAIAWSPDSSLIASASGVGDADDTVQVFNVNDGSRVYTYNGHSADVYAVAWSPDGKRIVSGGEDYTVQVWDALTGKNVFTYQGHNPPNGFGNNINALGWSPNGKRIASGSGDHTVQIWDATNGGHAFTYRGHTNFVNALAWSPDGNYIASGSDDHTVQVWLAR